MFFKQIKINLLKSQKGIKALMYTIVWVTRRILDLNLETCFSLSFISFFCFLRAKSKNFGNFP